MQRHSANRDAILDALRGTAEHPSARHIYAWLRRDLPHLSQSTVYRLLGQLEEDGLVRTVSVVNGEERFDARVADHAHFVCTRCGAVKDLGAQALDLPQLRGLADGAGTVESVELTLRGICISCRSGGSK